MNLKTDSLGVFASLFTAITTFVGFFVALFSFRSRTKQNQTEWTASLIRDFLLHEKYISVRRNLELYYVETQNNYVQCIISEIDPRIYCSKQEIDAGRDLEDFFAHLEFFCYLESQGRVTTQDIDASLGFWLSLLRKPNFVSLRVYLQSQSFEYIVAKIGGELLVNRFLVYGTLKTNSQANEILGLGRVSKSLGEFKIPGNLYSINEEYPGAHLDLDSIFSNYPTRNPETFLAELLEVDPLSIGISDLLKSLDDYENNGPRIEYRRYCIPSKGGQPAWIYDYIQETDVHLKIDSGIWN